MGSEDVGARSDQADLKERAMANDTEWVEDVRRWYYGGTAPAADVEVQADAGNDDVLGYEAAHPALQARHWPDAPSRELQL
jgi:hypothetical protein